MREIFLTMKPTTENHTFCLQLSNGVSCSAKLNPTRIADQLDKRIKPDALEIHWQGSPSPADFPVYLSWIAGVWQRVTDAAKKSALVVMLSPQGRAVCISCEPNQSPQIKFV
jgi:hypothetical protein